MEPRQENPFIVGDWIKEDKDFIGRTHLIDYFLSLQRPHNWLIGSRRMGKTSLLRFLQRRFHEDSRTCPLFWDVSAIRSLQDLYDTLQDSLDGALPDLQSRHLSFHSDQPQPDVYSLLRTLARACSERQMILMLLIDEAEALFGLFAREQDVLNKMKTLLDNEQIHVIMASNHGLESYDPLNTEHLLSPFLQGFAPPQFLQAWSREEALPLIERCTTAAEEQEQIISSTGGLPFLVQMVCFYYHDQHSLQAAVQIIRDRHLLDLFFRHDLHCLGETSSRMLAYLCRQQPMEKAVLDTLHRHQPLWSQRLTLLLQLGFIRVDAQGGYTIGNEFLSDWLKLAFPACSGSMRGTPAKLQHRLCLCLNRDTVRVDWNDQTIYVGRFPSVETAPSPLETARDAGHRLYQALFSIPALLPVKERLSTNHDVFQIYLEHVQGKCPPIEWLHDGHEFLGFRHAITRVREGMVQTGDRQDVAVRRILLIAADTPPAIPRVDQEIVLIREHIQNMAREKNIEMTVDCLFSHESDIDTVMNRLAAGRYDAVHYAGHAMAGEGSVDHRLFFRQKREDQQGVRAVWASEWLQQAGTFLQFLYINGCGGGRVLLPSDHPIPVRFLLFNRSEVMDESSARFAVELYRLLLDTDFPVGALPRLRQQWHERHAQDPALQNYWLWPVLYAGR